MTDIVERLRDLAASEELANEASNEIMRLRDDAAKWKALAEANANVLRAHIRREEREKRLMPNAKLTCCGK